MFRVGGEQAVQQRRPATRQADYEQRLSDFLLRDPSINLPVLLHPQPRAQRLQDVDFEGDFAYEAEPCLVLARLEQPPQTFEKIAFAEIIRGAGEQPEGAEAPGE